MRSYISSFFLFYMCTSVRTSISFSFRYIFLLRVPSSSHSHVWFCVVCATYVCMLCVPEISFYITFITTVYGAESEALKE